MCPGDGGEAGADEADWARAMAASAAGWAVVACASGHCSDRCD
jgi:hypothetical protein